LIGLKRIRQKSPQPDIRLIVAAPSAPFVRDRPKS
jgi:hypothetical protein